MIISKPIKIFILIGGIGLNTACATNQTPIAVQSESQRGAAVKSALAKQIVDPNPVAGAPTQHPAKAAAALDRYLNDDVKEPIETDELDFVPSN